MVLVRGSVTKCSKEKWVCNGMQKVVRCPRVGIRMILCLEIHSVRHADRGLDVEWRAWKLFVFKRSGGSVLLWGRGWTRMSVV